MINESNNEIIWSNEFLELQTFPKHSCGLFVATAEYIPIEFFKNAFNQAAKFAQNKEWKYFIFDKSNLNVFHQPSMEWYYTKWKRKLLKHGISTHFKILPQEKWFKASVEAGKDEIKDKHPDFDFSAFKVHYVSDVDEALAQISKQ